MVGIDALKRLFQPKQFYDSTFSVWNFNPQKTLHKKQQKLF